MAKTGNKAVRKRDKRARHQLNVNVVGNPRRWLASQADAAGVPLAVQAKLVILAAWQAAGSPKS